MTDKEKIDAVRMYLAQESMRIGNDLIAFRDDFETNPLSTVTVNDLNRLQIYYKLFKKIAADVSEIIAETDCI